MNYTFQFGVVFRQLPELLPGALLTFQIAFLSFWGGALFGLLLASLKTYGGPLWSRVSGSYVTFFTNTPALIQIYFIFWGLPEIGVVLDAVTSVVIGLTLNTAAYLCEVMRAGFLSVRSTEMEAAETLGFSRWQQIRHVIVPHIASSSLATRNKMATMAAANLEAGLKGEKLPHCANPEVRSAR